MSKEKHDHELHENPTIETLSTPPITILPAPIIKRFVASFIDCVILTAVWLLIVLQHQSPFQFSATNEGILVFITFIYYFALEGFFSSTVGKTILHLRVVDKEGDQCSYKSSLLRNVVRFIDWLPFLYVLGVACILASERRLRLGDWVAGTIVTTALEKDINPPPAPFLFH